MWWDPCQSQPQSHVVASAGLNCIEIRPCPSATMSKASYPARLCCIHPSSKCAHRTFAGPLLSSMPLCSEQHSLKWKLLWAFEMISCTNSAASSSAATRLRNVTASLPPGTRAESANASEQWSPSGACVFRGIALRIPHAGAEGLVDGQYYFM
jgi:hypothetical protein